MASKKVVETVEVAKDYLALLEQIAAAAQEHLDIKNSLWPAEKALLKALKAIKAMKK